MDTLKNRLCVQPVVTLASVMADRYYHLNLYIKPLSYVTDGRRYTDLDCEVHLRWQGNHPATTTIIPMPDEWYGLRIQTDVNGGRRFEQAARIVKRLVGDKYEVTPAAVIERLQKLGCYWYVGDHVLYERGHYELITPGDYARGKYGQVIPDALRAA